MAEEEEHQQRQQLANADGVGNAENECMALLRCVLPVACKGFVVGAGLHVGQGLIGGVVSRKLFKK